MRPQHMKVIIDGIIDTEFSEIFLALVESGKSHTTAFNMALLRIRRADYKAGVVDSTASYQGDKQETGPLFEFGNAHENAKAFYEIAKDEG